jgi:hypothetical protein
LDQRSSYFLLELLDLRVLYHQQKIPNNHIHKEFNAGQAQWLTPIIPATQETKIGRIEVLGESGKKLSISVNKPGVRPQA